MKNKTLIFIIIVALFALAVGAWFWTRGAAPVINSSQGEDKIKVTASFYPLYFLAERIGGERVEVNNLVPAGSEPHDYEPSARDLAELSGKDLVILSGNGLEAWQGSLESNLDPSRTALLIAGDGLANLQRDEAGAAVVDPHIWLDPHLLGQMAERISEALIMVDPDGRAYYEANEAALITDLDALNKSFRDALANCERRDIVTSHSAFAYLAAAYDLRQVPIAGLEPEAEPSAKQLAEISDFVRAGGIRYIFFEELASPELAETLAQEVGAETLVLDPLEGLSPDKAEAGADYLSVMAENLDNLKIALGCSNK